MNVHCVIVCYRPNIPQLLALCSSLLADNAQIALVDNTEAPYLNTAQLPLNCRLITLGANTGIAHAQNVGITAALESGAQVVAFFDQDSKVAPGFLNTLVAPLDCNRAEVVSPLYVDDATGMELPSLRVSRYGLSTTVHRSSSSSPYEVDVVISSGTVATKSVFQVAGLLDETLFIDFVDTEWCLRCRSKGISIRVVPAAVMRHSIGSKAIQLRFATVLIHSPARCYYQVRNCFLLFRKKHIPLLFSLRQTIALFVSRGLLLLFIDGRRPYLKAYLAGLSDGIRGLTGPRPY